MGMELDSIPLSLFLLSHPSVFRCRVSFLVGSGISLLMVAQQLAVIPVFS